MKEYSVKMVDGTRHDFIADHIEFDEDAFMMIRGDNKKVLLNGRFIVSITIKGDGDDS